MKIWSIGIQWSVWRDRCQRVRRASATLLGVGPVGRGWPPRAWYVSIHAWRFRDGETVKRRGPVSRGRAARPSAVYLSCRVRRSVNVHFCRPRWWRWRDARARARTHRSSATSSSYRIMRTSSPAWPWSSWSASWCRSVAAIPAFVFQLRLEFTTVSIYILLAKRESRFCANSLRSFRSWLCVLWKFGRRLKSRITICYELFLSK